MRKSYLFVRCYLFQTRVYTASSSRERKGGRSCNIKNSIHSSLSISSLHSVQMAPKPIGSPVSEAWYPLLSFFLISFGLAVTAMFFIYEATSSRRSRSLSTELTTGAVASVLLGFGSLFLLLATGVYV